MNRSNCVVHQFYGMCCVRCGITRRQLAEEEFHKRYPPKVESMNQCRHEFSETTRTCKLCGMTMLRQVIEMLNPTVQESNKKLTLDSIEDPEEKTQACLGVVSERLKDLELQSNQLGEIKATLEVNFGKDGRKHQGICIDFSKEVRPLGRVILLIEAYDRLLKEYGEMLRHLRKEQEGNAKTTG